MNPKRYAVTLHNPRDLTEIVEVVSPFYSEQQARDFAYSKEQPFSVVVLRAPTLKELSLAKVP